MVEKTDKGYAEQHLQCNIQHHLGAIWEKAGILLMDNYSVDTKLGRKIAAVDTPVGKWNADQRQDKALVSRMHDSLNFGFGIESSNCFKCLPVKVSCEEFRFILCTCSAKIPESARKFYYDQR